ncbi:caffeic acid 3-O-methyltransferase-like [Dioscorea cayenensis subsp. rotundata]|uniref:Caffeic acid 3-O-methyltransferase-like n=1 Tax=Dioscorea cayennensis subsp. rotundata TaxID=55577 RepID=A0AB40CLN6_DIOCR|nr:caffeic acid 3-O-methyltransferase-like [Dioscorea cayenensis subsp. rotundata]
MGDISAFADAMGQCCSIALPMTLKAMIELDVLEVMAAVGPGAMLSPEEIASKIQTSNPDAHEVLDRMLRFLAAHKVVTCEVVVGEEDGKSKRRYGLGPVCEFFTKDEDGTSLAPLLLMHLSKDWADTWPNLKHAVLDGSNPFVKTYGMTLFEYEDKDSHFSEMFNKAMFNLSTRLMKKILENYNGFESINVLVDVAGGHGGILSIILSKYPHIKAINFDLPHVVSQAKPIQGVEFVGGDMFESVPTGDAIIIKGTLHNWSDADCVKVLKNCWKALPDDGKIVLIEHVIPENAEEARNTLFLDIIMLTYFVGGKGRSEKEFQFLAKESGFSKFKIACNYYYYVMELYK